MPSAAHVAAVAVGFPLGVLALGWAVLRPCSLDAEERFAAAWGAGFAVLALLAFLAFLLGANQAAFILVGSGLVVGLALARGRRRPGEGMTADAWRLAALCALGYAALVGTQALLPTYEGGHWYGDWWMHYDAALVFRGQHPSTWTWGPYNLTSRNPLFNLAAAALLAVAGDAFWVYQLGATLLSVVVVCGLYLVLRDFWGVRVGRLGMVLAGLNLWLVHHAWFTWPKMLAAYYLLLGLHGYVQWLRRRPTQPAAAARSLALAWGAGLLAFLTHQVALLYLAALAVHGALLAWRQRAYRLRRREVLVLALLAGLLLAPWYGYVLGRFGVGTALTSTPATQDTAGTLPGPGVVLQRLTLNTVRSLVPTVLVSVLAGGEHAAVGLFPALEETYFCHIPGALTASLTLFLLLALARPPRPCRLPGTEGLAFAAFGVLGAVGALAVTPVWGRNGCAHASCFPSVLLLLVAAWGLLCQAGRPVRLAVGLGMLAEFVLLFWGHVLRVPATRPTGEPGWSDMNWILKDTHHLVFLNDLLGSATPVAMGFVAAAQLALAVLLLRGLGRSAASASPSAGPDVPAVERVLQVQPAS